MLGPLDKDDLENDLVQEDNHDLNGTQEKPISLIHSEKVGLSQGFMAYRSIALEPTQTFPVSNQFNMSQGSPFSNRDVRDQKDSFKIKLNGMAGNYLTQSRNQMPKNKVIIE